MQDFVPTKYTFPSSLEFNSHQLLHSKFVHLISRIEAFSGQSKANYMFRSLGPSVGWLKIFNAETFLNAVNASSPNSPLNSVLPPLCHIMCRVPCPEASKLSKEEDPVM